MLFHRNMTRQRKVSLITFSIIIFVAVVTIFSAVGRCAYLIKENYTIQLKQNLTDVSYQCGDTLEHQIHSTFDLLKSLNDRFEVEEDNRYEALDRFDYVVKEFHLKRIGFVDADGLAYTTDGEGGNLSYRDFFKASMEGNVYLSDVLEDALDPSHAYVTIMTMPMHDKNGQIVGITGITYETEKFSDELAMKSFEGYGDNFVLNQNGHVAVTSNSAILRIGDSISGEAFDVINNGQEVKDAFVRSFAKKEALDGELKFNGENYYFQLTPVELLDGDATWFVLSLVPYDYLASRYNGIRYNLYKMIAIVLGIVFLCAIGTRYFFRNQRRLAYSLAYRSQLTGGPNLSRFFDNMRYAKNRNGYIAYMNLEDFAHTSVATGIEKSNQLIKKIWCIIRDNMKQDEFACHDKADCFVLFMRESDEEVFIQRLQKIRDLIHEEGHAMEIPWVFAKFGACKITEEDDIKLAYSKAEYTVTDTWGLRDIVSFYNEEDHEQQAANKDIEEKFGAALNEKRFEVWFQPKYDVTGERLTGSEALVRWRRKNGSLLPPGLFIPVLEKNGDIAELDDYVFESVCEKLREWKNKGYNTVPVSINVSRATLYRDKIVDNYMNYLTKYGLSPDDVQVEVTETIVGGSENIQELLGQFRSHGIKVLMDDFGTGYSSLATLNMKCFDTLKIDKSLIDEIGNDYGWTIVYQTIEMGNALGMYITVEGVEKKEQLDLLNETKCNDVQGYYFSKPLPADEFEALISK